MGSIRCRSSRRRQQDNQLQQEGRLREPINLTQEPVHTLRVSSTRTSDVDTGVGVKRLMCSLCFSGFWLRVHFFFLLCFEVLSVLPPLVVLLLSPHNNALERLCRCSCCLASSALVVEFRPLLYPALKPWKPNAGRWLSTLISSTLAGYAWFSEHPFRWWHFPRQYTNYINPST